MSTRQKRQEPTRLQKLCSLVGHEWKIVRWLTGDPFGRRCEVCGKIQKWVLTGKGSGEWCEVAYERELECFWKDPEYYGLVMQETQVKC